MSCPRPKMTDIVQHVPSHLPSSPTPVNAFPIDEMLDDRGPDAVSFRISRDEHEWCNVLGFNLSAFNTDYGGPIQFITPLNPRWPDGQPTRFFDSSIHGYHVEMDSSEKLCGSGDPAVFKCTEYVGDSLVVSVQIDYHEDLLEEFAPSEVSDYFHNMIVCGTCTVCPHCNLILNMDLYLATVT